METIEQLRAENERLRQQVEVLLKDKVHYRRSSTCCANCDHIMFGRCDYLDAYVGDAYLCDMFVAKQHVNPNVELTDEKVKLTEEERMQQWKEYKNRPKE